MRKVKLQMQSSVDNFVAGSNGEMDWMVWNWDDELNNYVTKLTETVDLILLGRKLAEGFIPHWTSAASDPASPEFAFAKEMTDRPKIVFSKTLKSTDPLVSEWENTKLANGNIVEEIAELKNQPGKDIIVYGGAGFVSSLIRNNLIDEYHLFVNPAALGNGMTIFKDLENRLSSTSCK
ncbi:MAG: dihydrofolate reductase family protein [Segetibacter sp.]